MPGPRPASELARYDKIYAERAGVSAPATAPAAPGTALSVLAAVLDRDGQQHSASQTRSQALADADHLALLHAIWAAETSPAREQRYRNLLAAALPGHHTAPGPRDRWLWRTLHGAELAGLDPAQVLADAIGEGDLAGARDIPAVIDTRIRNRIGFLVPLPAGLWSEQVPAITDPERRAYVTQIAELMDARKERLGEYVADAQHAELTLTAGEETSEMGQWIKDLAAGRRIFADRLANRQSVKIPSEDPDYGDLGPAFPARTSRGREPILQPPKPEIPPSPRILERVTDRDVGWEAAD